MGTARLFFIGANDKIEVSEETSSAVSRGRCAANFLLELAPKSKVSSTADLRQALECRAHPLEREAVGEVRAADFFWREMLGDVERFWRRSARRDGALSEIITAATSDGPCDVDIPALAEALLREVFVETHLRILCGMPPGDERSIAHVDFARRLIELLADGEVKSELSSALDLYDAERRIETQQWRAATKWFAGRADGHRERGQGPLGDAHINHAAKLIQGAGFKLMQGSDNKRMASFEASALEEAVTALDALCKAAPHLLGPRLALCELNCLLAIKRASLDEHAPAARAVRSARLYDPSSRTAAAVWDQLAERVSNFRKEFDKAIASHAPGTVSLNAEGERLREDLVAAERLMRTGFAGAMESQMTGAYALANDRATWLAVGIGPGETPTTDAEKGAALARVLKQAPPHETTHASVSDATGPTIPPDAVSYIQLLLEREAALVALSTGDRELVAGFVAAVWSGTAVPIPETLPLEGQVPTIRSVIAPHPAIDPPPHRRAGIEPLRPWLVSRQSRGARMALAASLLMLAGGASVAAVDWQLRSARDDAYARIVAAARTGDLAGGRGAVARFRAASQHPLAAWRLPDPRAPVVDVLNIGLANSASQPARETSLRAAEAAFAAGDITETLRQLAGYRAALPPGLADPRSPQADRLEALAHDAGARRARDAAVTRLQRALAAENVAEATDAAEAFFANISVAVDDARAPAVRELLAIAKDRVPLRVRDNSVAAMQQALAVGDVGQVLDAGARFFGNMGQDRPDPRATDVTRELESAIVSALASGDDQLDDRIAAAARSLGTAVAVKN